LNILFTDKTGTLTKGKPEVSVFLDGSGAEYRRQENIRKTPLWELICLSGYYNTDCQLSGKELLGGNSTDKALMEYIRSRHPLNTDCTVTAKSCFDSEKKWSGVEIAGDFFVPEGFEHNRITLVKGAPDILLRSCSQYMDVNGILHPFDVTSELYRKQNQLEKNAMRILALAISDKPLNEDPTELVLLGLAGLRDELRHDVKRSVAEVQAAGIQVVMMTGDSRETATAIAQSAGLLSTFSDSDAILTSDQIASMSDEKLCEKLPSLRVIARALPGDKSRLIRLAQSRELVVGMTGDGINDAPALKKADVGFAMGSGTEVAKQAGDIVILNDHFSSIAKAILYGRTIFKSIRKFIIFQLTMNLCAVGVSVIGPFLGVDMPVTVMQMLWINIIMDTLAGLAFAGEPPLPEYMREPPKKRAEPVVNRYMLNQILCTGVFTTMLCVIFLHADIFKALFRYDVDSLYWMTAFFALFVFSGIFNSFNARPPRLNLLAHLRNNTAFVVIVTLVAAVQIALIYYGGTLFRTAGLTVQELLAVLAFSLLVIPFDWLRKIILRLNHRKGTI
jgi:calcium-translocating P-type ATPase